MALNSAIALELDELEIPCIPLIQPQVLSSWPSLNRELRVLAERVGREWLTKEGSACDPYVSSASHMWMPTLISSINRQFALASALRDLLKTRVPQSVEILMTQRQEEEEYAVLVDLLVRQQVPFSRSL